ncbi:glycosyltransferase family 8 protein [Fructilactobacillus carniphilus]|uniref:Glycosyltransferase family 8 protein n=1 Tax=Fructilactobacillus carniphilus TaxID=2940297 RepID=A0ABY5BV44_9LACO|nr:glycosyltransferase family 8 protein [Fructilactobacillus carniphilus]USS90365.1 glycosyltransferase family 8 protein [Fructilactobacillus carniphilus]
MTSTEPIEILVTSNQNYIDPLKVMLYSLRLNNQKAAFRVWLLQSDISAETNANLLNYAGRLNLDLNVIKMDERVNLPKSFLSVYDYPQEMYFRLLCADSLPNDLHKVLYLDPDLLVVNDIMPLWETNLDGKMFAAAVHKGLTDIMRSINNLRLGTDGGYYNSGVMLMDLDQMRQKIKVKDIVETVEKYHDYLVLPDQDILNYLYSNDTKEISEDLWNFDARKSLMYLTRSGGKENLDWIMKHTRIIHFCGKPKPWQADSNSPYTALWLNYQQIVTNHFN